MPQRPKLRLSFANITLGKVIAYLFAAYAICMLVRAAFLGSQGEPFATPAAASAASTTVPLCNSNTRLPCHYREQRGENVSCDYEWNAPAVFRKDVRLSGATTDAAMKKLKFCSLDSGEHENISASSCKHTMSSVWDKYTSGLNRSNRALQVQVDTLGQNVDQMTRDVDSSRTAMARAETAMEASAPQASSSSSTLAAIEDSLRQQKTCDSKLAEATAQLMQTNRSLQDANKEIARLQSIIQNYQVADQSDGSASSGVGAGIGTATPGTATPGTATPGTATPGTGLLMTGNSPVSLTTDGTRTTPQMPLSENV